MLASQAFHDTVSSHWTGNTTGATLAPKRRALRPKAFFLAVHAGAGKGISKDKSERDRSDKRTGRIDEVDGV